MTRSDGISLTRARFGNAADAYGSSDVHARGESLDVLERNILPGATWRMLDVATGAGHTALRFAPRVDLVITADLTREMLQKTEELAKGRGISNVATVLADAETLPFEEGIFDLLTCRLACHHFPDQGKALSEFHRVLTPKGVLGFTDNVSVEDPRAVDYYNAYERLRDPSHQWVYSPNELKNLIRSAGFELKFVEMLTKEFEFHDWADRQHVSDSGKGRLLAMMREAPDELVELFDPRWEGGTLYFKLRETVVVAERC